MHDWEIREALKRIEHRLDALTRLCEEILKELPQPTYTAPAGFSFTATA